MFLVDTNILLDIFHDDPAWRPWSEPCLRDALLEGEVGINPIIYAETSLGFRAPETLDAELDAIAVSDSVFPTRRRSWPVALFAATAAPAAFDPLRSPISSSARTLRWRVLRYSPAMSPGSEPTFPRSI